MANIPLIGLTLVLTLSTWDQIGETEIGTEAATVRALQHRSVKWRLYEQAQRFGLWRRISANAKF